MAVPSQRSDKKPGILMRQLRKQCGLTMRDVEKASLRLAKELGNKKRIVMPSQLSLIERKRTVPNIYRFDTLARIYKVSLKKLLSIYGV
jgi:transcriptional regulator with XRE-family HTH domain